MSHWCYKALGFIPFIALAGILGLYYENLADKKGNGDSGVFYISKKSITAEYSRKDPVVKTLRCDACLRIATIFDDIFEAVDGRLTNGGDEELEDSAVDDIVNRVCSKRTFRQIKPVEIDGLLRLKDELESAPPSESNEVDWSKRLKYHCLYLATEKLKSREIYDMWLRVSAGSFTGFEQFLCYGEGPFSDCIETKDDNKWPAEDEMKENGDEAEEDFNENDRFSFLWDEDYSYSSASRL